MPDTDQEKRTERDLKGDHFRTFNISGKEREAIDVEKRTVELSFSSEDKLVERFGFVEQLVHTEEAADLARLNDGGALLLDHDRTKQIGVIESARIDPTEKKARAVVRFSKSALGEEVFQDVIDGIRKNVSVGFRVLKFEETAGEGEPDLVRILEWEAFEVSFVSIPADEKVGVGREMTEAETKKPETQEFKKTERKQTMSEEKKAEPQVNVDQVRSETQKAERERIANINGVVNKFPNENVRKLAKEAIQDGMDSGEFYGRALVMIGEAKEVDTTKGPESSKAHLGMREGDLQNYSIRKALAGHAGYEKFDGVEREAHDELVKRIGAPRQGGVLIPMDAQMKGMQKRATQIAGTDSLGGYLVETENRGFIETLYNNTLTKQLGIQTISGLQGDITMPRQITKSSFTWVAENSAATESNLTFDNVSMTPKTASGFVPMSRQLLMQSDPSIDMLVQNDLARVLGIGIDSAVIEGTGGTQPTGILNTSGVGVQTTAAHDWAKMVGFETTAAAANGLTGRISFLTTPAIRGTLKTSVKETGQATYIWENNEINGYPAFASTNMPAASTIFGDWSTVVLGEWGVLELRTIDQGTNYRAGEVEVLAFVSVDVAVRQPAKLVQSEDFT